jgi:hypothetical protein
MRKKTNKIRVVTPKRVNPSDGKISQTKFSSQQWGIVGESMIDLHQALLFFSNSLSLTSDDLSTTAPFNASRSPSGRADSNTFNT